MGGLTPTTPSLGGTEHFVRDIDALDPNGEASSSIVCPSIPTVAPVVGLPFRSSQMNGGSLCSSLSVAMSNSTTVSLPVQTKQRLDRLHGVLHITDGIPRWQTIERAIQALADDEGVDLEPDAVDDETNSGRRVERGRGR